MNKAFSWTLRDLIVLTLTAAALGVLWWGWTFLYEVVKGPLRALHPALSYLAVGFWFSGGTVIPALIRKPGAAFGGEVVAAFVQGLITQWGWTSLLWGAVQGTGSELAFALGGYKRWSLPFFLLSGALAGLFSWVLDFFYENYSQLSPEVWAVQLGAVVLSGLVFAGFLGWALERALRRSQGA